jgi:hypothetical protein
MMKAFLSHSSKDKHFVQKVAEELTTNWCVYDAFSFDEGTLISDEIISRLNETDLFVIFLSENALKSEWVQTEIKKAYDLWTIGEMKTILPIIIDDKTTHSSEGIPLWLKNHYNIKPIRRYKKVVQRIRQELIKISWSIYENKKDLDNLFVGRNNLIDTLEGRYREKFNPPLAVIASGISGIGRKSLVKEYLKKIRLIDISQQIPIIVLESNESIEDAILKIYDLGFSEFDLNFNSIASMSLDKKIDLLLNLFYDIQQEKEIIFIEDNGCLVLPEGNLNSWMLELLKKEKTNGTIFKQIIGIISKYKFKKSLLISIDNIYAIDVPELEAKETSWMLKELLRIQNIQIKEDEFNKLLPLLVGHPEQVKYAIELIKYEGFTYLYDNSYLIPDFNQNRISHLLNQYKDNEKAKSLLAYLAQFDFLDFELLQEFIDNDRDYTLLVNNFISESICNQIGSNKEMIKMNKAFRDIIRRNDWKESEDLKLKTKDHVASFLSTYKSEDKSLSDYFYSIQQILIKEHEKLNLTTIIPSHILKTIAELYDGQKKWKSVVVLAENALNENFNEFDEQIENQIRKYLCLAYIRTKRNDDFLREVQKIYGPTHDFLLGFFYRTTGRYSEAVEKFKQVLIKIPTFQKAKRELVQVYMSTHDYNTALEMAKDNYYASPSNPYLFQAYSTCLMKSAIVSKDEEIDKLLKKFNIIGEDSQKSREMYEIENARYLAYKKNPIAIDKINDTIAIFRDSIYPAIAKFDICEKLNNVEGMKNSLQLLKNAKEKLPNDTLIKIDEAILNAKEGRKEQALLMIQQLKYYPEKSKALLIEKN